VHILWKSHKAKELGIDGSVFTWGLSVQIPKIRPIFMKFCTEEKTQDPFLS